jgi:hypothetical protein
MARVRGGDGTAITFPGVAPVAIRQGRCLAGPMTGARKESVVFIELDTRQDADATVSLEWGRDTGETQAQ